MALWYKLHKRVGEFATFQATPAATATTPADPVQILDTYDNDYAEPKAAEAAAASGALNNASTYQAVEQLDITRVPSATAPQLNARAQVADRVNKLTILDSHQRAAYYADQARGTNSDNVGTVLTRIGEDEKGYKAYTDWKEASKTERPANPFEKYMAEDAGLKRFEERLALEPGLDPTEKAALIADFKGRGGSLALANHLEGRKLDEIRGHLTPKASSDMPLPELAQRASRLFAPEHRGDVGKRIAALKDGSPKKAPLEKALRAATADKPETVERLQGLLNDKEVRGEGPEIQLSKDVGGALGAEDQKPGAWKGFMGGVGDFSTILGAGTSAMSGVSQLLGLLKTDEQAAAARRKEIKGDLEKARTEMTQAHNQNMAALGQRADRREQAFVSTKGQRDTARDQVRADELKERVGADRGPYEVAAIVERGAGAQPGVPQNRGRGRAIDQARARREASNAARESSEPENTGGFFA